jgi:hypothetical protein
MCRSYLIPAVSWVLCSFGILLLLVGFVLVTESPALAQEGTVPGPCTSCGGTCGGLIDCDTLTCAGAGCPAACGCAQGQRCYCNKP